MIDLSSDTATRPTDEMRRYMCFAPVGDEQRGEDPTVLELEGRVAALTGKEASLFLPSCTMANVIAYYVHCRAGDEVILHEDAHPISSENAGPAVHSRVSLRAVSADRGIFSGPQVESAVRPAGSDKPRTRLVSVENTTNRGGGSVWGVSELKAVWSAAAAHGLATHLDGARLLNATVRTQIAAAELCAGFDSVAMSLSKGLGCPAGALLAATSSFIEEARWAKHLFGGAMRQTGILAAAGLYALDHHVVRLSVDHERAQLLADGLAGIPNIEVLNPEVETNILLFDIRESGISASGLLQRLGPSGVRFSVLSPSRLRAVTHLDIGSADIDSAVSAVRQALGTPSTQVSERPHPSPAPGQLSR